MKVLLVRLPEEIAKYIPLVLKVRWPNLSLLHTDDPQEALQLLHTEQPRLALLHLPERSEGSSPEDCFDLISQVRSFSDVPLIVVGQGDDVMDKVKALEMGADDWLSPYSSPMEFIAKVNAILRRCSADKQGVSSFLDGRLSIDYATRQVWVWGRPVKLTPIQYRIFCYLAENEGRVCTTGELLRYVWGPNSGEDRELLKLNVYRLRSKIEQDPSNPEIIFNERGAGYFIRAPSPTA
ncbi:MAG: winged helix-turn-helix domain-containing protein [Dehalococcoidia bacterium]